MDTGVLIKALKQVPERKLKIIDLTWQLVNEDGEIDQNKVVLYFKEVKEAVDEVKAYTEETRRALECLRKMVRF